jgi:hypothetical protein
MSASRTTQTTYTAGSTYAALSDHSVNMQYYEEYEYGNPEYQDVLGFSFLPGYSYPFDHYFESTDIYTTSYSEAIYLGNTYIVAVLADVLFNTAKIFELSSTFVSFPNTATLNAYNSSTVYSSKPTSFNCY